MSALADKIVAEAPMPPHVTPATSYESVLRLVVGALERANVNPAWIPYHAYEAVGLHITTIAAECHPKSGGGGWQERDQSIRLSALGYAYYQKARSVLPAMEKAA